MIITLDALKGTIGIALDDATQNDDLTSLINAATAWVESETHRRFQAPVSRTEYRRGTGTDTLYLMGHVVGSVVVSERVYAAAWSDLTVDTDYEVRGNSVVRLDDCAWGSNAEYRLVYDDGYPDGDAPADIQAVVLELSSGRYAADTASASGTQGTLLHEDLAGVYSYTLEKTKRNFSGAPGGGELSDTGISTINRWRRGII